MLPLTMLTAQKTADLLTRMNAIEAEVNLLAVQTGQSVPTLKSSQVFVTSTPAAMADLQQQLGYPRISIYSNRIKNQQLEKFRSLSGTATVIAEIGVTADLVDQVDLWIHFYVEAVANILRRNTGDWGDGVFFSGTYDVEMQVPKTGASGFLQTAKVTCELNISRN